MAGEIVPVGRGEKIILAVNRNNFKPIIAQVLASKKFIDNRDVGDIVGLPLEDVVKSKALRGQSLITKLRIFFYSYQQPPFKAQTGLYFVRARVTIPDPNPNFIDWLRIKNTAGGVNGYLWGRFRATATMATGRKIVVYGGSEEEAGKKLHEFAALSTSKINSLIISEEKKEGLRQENKTLYKQSVRVYPAYFAVINEEKVLVESQRENGGINGTLAGDFSRATTKKIPLWVTNEPSDSLSIIREALRVRGVSSQK